MSNMLERARAGVVAGVRMQISHHDIAIVNVIISLLADARCNRGDVLYLRNLLGIRASKIRKLAQYISENRVGLK